MYEGYSPLVEVIQAVTGEVVHPQTARRWVSTGVSGVKLDAAFINGRMVTSREAVEQFVVASTQAKLERLTNKPKPPKIEPARAVKPARAQAALSELNSLYSKGKKRGAK